MNGDHGEVRRSDGADLVGPRFTPRPRRPRDGRPGLPGQPLCCRRGNGAMGQRGHVVASLDLPEFACRVPHKNLQSENAKKGMGSRDLVLYKKLLGAEP